MKKTYPTRQLSLDYLIEEYSILFETPSYPGGESALAEIIKCIKKYIPFRFKVKVVLNKMGIFRLVRKMIGKG